MKFILTVFGIVLLAMAGVYFLMPADQLPGFFPGHEDGVTRLHVKHGIVSVPGVVTVLGFVAVTVRGRTVSVFTLVSPE